ncbi:MAG: hybrid sensor histidine kinase/response regulator, partial [Nitrospirales bacterium]
ASLINSGILVALLWSVVPQEPIAWWFTSVLVVNGLWGLFLYRYHQCAKHEASLDQWANWFLLGNAASGCIWGIGGILLYPYTSIGHEVFLTFVFGGMIAGATALYASYFPAFLAFSLPAATPLTLLLFSRGDSLHVSMGVMGLLFIIVMTMTTRRNHTMLLESMTLHQENSTLVYDLTQARDRAEALNNSLSKEVTHRAAVEEKLRRHQEHLETLVEARTAALQSSESRYRFVTENISDVIWMMEPDGSRFSYVSPSVKEFRGYSAEEVMASSLDECLTPSSLEKAQWAMHQQLERLAKEPDQLAPFLLLELEHQCKDGSTVWAEVRASLLSDKEGHPLGFVGMTRDLTERRKLDREKHQLEAQVLRSQKMDAIGTLAGGIAHDFNNLLTSILGNITLTQHIMKLPPLGEKYLTRAEQATWRAKDLTQQLLAFAKGGDPIKHLISLRDLIIESSGFALSGSSVLCEQHLATDLWPIEADPGQVSQIIHNIGINAVQAMPNGGRLVIQADNMWINKFSGGSPIPLPPGPYVHVTLSDEGIGIAQKHLDKVFDPYFSTKPEGQGLGLTSTYAIIKKHGGHISVESQANVGTKFSLYFPACASGVKPIKLGTAPLQHGRGRILVMDDEEPIRLLAKEMLAHCGYQCELAKDGHEAIARFQQAIEKRTPFSAVILDLTVPGSLGGKDTILRLREIDPHVIAFVSSGYSNDPIMANYKTYGFHGVITKPYSLIGLSTILHQNLGVISPQSAQASLPNPEPSQRSDSNTH